MVVTDNKGAHCPHCGAGLTRSEIGRLYASLRKVHRGGRKSRRSSKRKGETNMETTPRASKLMPHVLNLLQQSARPLAKKEIDEAMRAKVSEMGYTYRAPALGYALTYLKRITFVNNPQHGVWMVTERGRSVHLEENSAREIERRIEEGYPRVKTIRY